MKNISPLFYLPRKLIINFIDSNYRILREKEILHSALDFIGLHEERVQNGTVLFQLELKAQERIDADLREAEHKKFLEEIKEKAAQKGEFLATIEVDLGPNVPKANLTLREGWGLTDTVKDFCIKHRVAANYVETLEKALKARIRNPPPLSLILGVVNPLGDRHILAIPEHSNYTVEVGVFCARYNVTSRQDCLDIEDRVKARLEVPFQRRIVLIVPIDAPDSRKLQLIIREGEQHDIRQFVSDFFELYSMPEESVQMMANEVSKRLPAAVLTIPVQLGSRRSVTARFAANENVTATVEGFTNFFEIDEGTKVAIFKRARYGMAPGTFQV